MQPNTSEAIAFLGLSPTSWGILALATLPALSGCDIEPPSPPPTPAQVAAKQLASVTDLGEGVYMMPNADFAATLVTFKREHPELRIVSVTQGSDYRFGGGSASTRGCAEFIVITEPAANR